jgi:hypothetical protein
MNLSAKGQIVFDKMKNQFQFQLLVARPARNKEPEFTPVIGSNDMDEIQEYFDLFKKDGYLVTVVNIKTI